MLPKKLKQKWVKMLESGRYLQAQGALHKGGRRYCCLGVLERAAGVPVKKLENFNTLMSFYDGGEPVLRGLSQSTRQKLILMNDNGKSFSDIAAWIRKSKRV